MSPRATATATALAVARQRRSSGALSPSRLRRLGEVLRRYVDRGEIAGAVALLCRRDEVHVEVVGAQDLETKEPMQRDTIFRIASMTKPITAAAAMILVEEARLRLDDPVDHWLPELANRRVLRRIDSPIDDTVPASRSITLRDLLTFRLGLGAVMEPPGRYPIRQAIEDAGLAPGPAPSPLTPDEWMKRAGGLPLIHQPGERWMYHTGSDVLGVLIARVAGTSLEEFLRGRIFGPLGMKRTGFSVPEADLGSLATCYHTPDRAEPRDEPHGRGRLEVYDQARGGRWSRPPAFASGGGGLASTADDYLAFARMMLGGGRHGQERILARPTVEVMTADHLTAEQKAASPFFPGFWDNRGWGFGMEIATRRDSIGPAAGSFGWDGGLGTSWRSDPREQMTGIFLAQRLMTSPAAYDIAADFWTLAYQAIDD